MDTDFVDCVSSWSVQERAVGGDHFNCIRLITCGEKIEVEFTYKKIKSAVFDGKLNDSIYFYSNNLEYLEIVAALTDLIPKRKKAPCGAFLLRVD